MIDGADRRALGTFAIMIVAVAVATLSMAGVLAVAVWLLLSL